ncbi:DDE superfamily endonuclease [Nitzschia inconspicua]|uniref:DDE superfamily endonuclease n=1 Tax=Nitzschia inconspicua TaxID=303405 RepID=A0A9K3KFY5_9STRA|nr:DDE superfamily endonuclease [Nitzschia inconspicua]
MGNKLPTPPLHSTHDENAASDSSVATDSDDASNGSDEVDLEAEGEEADLLTNGPAYYNMFLDLEEEECVKPKVKKRRGPFGIRVFFHRYIEFGSTTLFQKYVLAPTTLEHANQQGNEYAMAVLAGAVGSMDAPHVLCHKMKRKLRQSHLGFKLNGTAKTYNLVCNHRSRRTLRVVQIQREGRNYQERLQGAWLLTDNGYHKWSTTVPPYKSTTSRKQIKYSEWLESMRKDVECTFGILKGRWCILKTGITIQSIADADNTIQSICGRRQDLEDMLCTAQYAFRSRWLGREMGVE